VAATTSRYRVLARTDLPADTIELAQRLVGKIVVREAGRDLLSGRIVETEAYPPGDPASHAYIGETRRNHALFLSPGHAYVYLAYGTSYMLNVSSEAQGVGAGVLIRALEPLDGIAMMQRNRGVESLRDLPRGPGRLAAAFDIDRRLDGVDLCNVGPLWLADDGHAAPDIGTSPRIGISRAAEAPLRFFDRGSPYLSGPKSRNR
jgi:DNA-3-methyladenine glycosylase